MLVMAKERKPKQEPKPQFPSRAGYKGTYLPKAIYDELEKIAKREERSVAFLVHRAVREYLERANAADKQ